jgi:hypothetical protein
MTTRGSFIVVLLGSLLAVPTAGHAESAWKLWQQTTVFTERWWVPKGWSFHWKAACRSFKRSLNASWQSRRL